MEIRTDRPSRDGDMDEVIGQRSKTKTPRFVFVPESNLGDLKDCNVEGQG